MKVLITLGRLPKGLELAYAFAQAGCEVTSPNPSPGICAACRATCGVPCACQHRTTTPRLSRCTLPADRKIGHRSRGARVGRDHARRRPGRRARIRARWCASVLPRPGNVAGPARQVRLYQRRRCSRVAGARECTVWWGRGSGPSRGTAGPQALHRQAAVFVSGQGLRQFEAGTQLKVAADEPPTVLQAYLPGAELSTFGVVRDGVVVANVVYRGCIMSGTVAVCFERLDDYPQQSTIGCAATPPAVATTVSFPSISASTKMARRCRWSATRAPPAVCTF